MAFSYVQSANNSSDASDTTIVKAFGSNVGSGRLIIIQIAHGSTTDQVSSVTDSLSTAYTEIRFLSGQNVSGSIWYGVTSSSGANTVTANLAVTQPFRRMAIHEYSGQSSSPLDTSNATRNAPQPANSGNITTAVAGELIFGCFHWDQGGDETISAGTNESWTLRENYQHANAPAATEDFIQSVAGTTHAEFTEGGSLNNVLCFIAAFKPAAFNPEEDPLFPTFPPMQSARDVLSVW